MDRPKIIPMNKINSDKIQINSDFITGFKEKEDDSSSTFKKRISKFFKNKTNKKYLKRMGVYGVGVLTPLVIARVKKNLSTSGGKMSKKRYNSSTRSQASLKSASFKTMSKKSKDKKL